MIFVFVGSVGLIKERPTFLKTAAVSASIGGVIFLSFCCNVPPPQNISFQHPIIGAILTIFGSVLLALYQVYFKKLVKESTNIHLINFIFGIIGLFTLLGIWPLLILYHFSDWESFQIPAGVDVLYLLYHTLIFMCAYYGMSVSIAIASPFFITMGISLAFPISLLIDKLIQSGKLSPYWVIGVLMMILSFVIVNISYYLINKYPEPAAIDEPLYLGWRDKLKRFMRR